MGGLTEEGWEKGRGRASEATPEASTPEDFHPLAALCRGRLASATCVLAACHLLTG